MSDVRVLFVAGAGADNFRDRIAADAELMAEDPIREQIAANQSQIVAHQQEMARLALGRLPRKSIVPSPAAAPTWATTQPKQPGTMSGTKSAKRLDEMTPSERRAFLELA